MNPTVELSDFSFLELSPDAKVSKFHFNQSSEKLSIHKIILISHLYPGAPWLTVLGNLQIKITYHWTSDETQAVLLNPLLWVHPMQLHPVFAGFDLPTPQTIGFGSQSNKRIDSMSLELIRINTREGEEKPVLQFAYKTPVSITVTEG